MSQFFEFIDYLIDIFVLATEYLISFFTMVGRAYAYVIDVLVLMPTYFSIGILPFIAFFVVLMILDRG